MSKDHSKTNLESNDEAYNKPQAGKCNLLLRLAIFIAWVGIFGLLISLMACKQREPEIFVTKKLAECKYTYQSNAIGMPILVSTLKGISLYISRTSCEKRSDR